MRRRLFTIINGLVLLLFVAVIVLYVRSYYLSDGLVWTIKSTRLILQTGEGQVDVFIRTGVDWSPEHGFERIHEHPPVSSLLAIEMVDQAQWGSGLTLRQVPAWFHYGGPLKNFGWAFVSSQLPNGFIVWTMIPIWVICIGLGVVPLVWTLRVYRRHRLARALRCGECGYKLMGNTSGVCPECGTSLAESIPAPSHG